mmetsp:Transcript_4338/g.7768  ORF Transcript_4338/g.7768 Transcript_4338/m.7768 type:complete len:169 (-) Transcript_4338:311-817(-)
MSMAMLSQAKASNGCAPTSRRLKATATNSSWTAVSLTIQPSLVVPPTFQWAKRHFAIHRRGVVPKEIGQHLRKIGAATHIVQTVRLQLRRLPRRRRRHHLSHHPLQLHLIPPRHHLLLQESVVTQMSKAARAFAPRIHQYLQGSLAIAIPKLPRVRMDSDRGKIGVAT